MLVRNGFTVMAVSSAVRYTILLRPDLVFERRLDVGVNQELNSRRDPVARRCPRARSKFPVLPSLIQEVRGAIAPRPSA